MFWDVDTMYDLGQRTHLYWHLKQSYNGHLGKRCCSREAVMFHKHVANDLYLKLVYDDEIEEWYFEETIPIQNNTTDIS